VTPHPDAPVPKAAQLLGLRTAKYTAPDLAAAKAWYQTVLGFAPYFDEPFYVGFSVRGFELGIVPDPEAGDDRPESGVAYWGVASADAAYDRLLALGATPFEAIQDVGGGIRIGAVRDPFGNILGVIENPGFKIEL
jgi:predicted enzyme related to lactoylglutathione lyase